MMKIKELRALWPAIVEFEEDGNSNSVLIYMDQIKGEVIIPEVSEIKNLEAFEEAVRKYMIDSVVRVEAPSVPREGFEKLDPESYMGDE